jgi:hypothetical protein
MLRELGLLGASLAASLAVGELAVRAVLPRPGFVAFPVAETHGVIQRDPLRGHAYAPNLSRHVVTADYEVDFRTNELGLRDVPLAEVPADALRMLAVGDSYTQGHGVRAEQAWPKVLQARLPNAHVFNAGVSGYGLQQMRSTAEALRERLRPRAILVGVYGHGYGRVNEPYELVGDGAGLVQRSAVERVGVEDDGFLLPAFERPALRDVSFWIDRHWYLGGHLMHALLGPRGTSNTPRIARESPGRAVLERELAPMLGELAALAADARRWGTPLVALLINSAETGGGFSPLQRGYNEVIAAFARARGICCVDPLPAFDAEAEVPLRFVHDPHWTPRAHALAAEQIVRELERSLGAAAPEDRACEPAARLLLGR